MFFVDSPTAAFGSLNPGSSAYAATALASGNIKLLFSAGKRRELQQITVPAGKYLAFYTITSGSTANFLLTNSADYPNGGPVAFSRSPWPIPTATNTSAGQAPKMCQSVLAKQTAHHGSDFRQRERFRRSHRRPDFSA